MQGQAAEALSPIAQRRLSIIAAGSIAAIAIVLAMLIALRSPEYEAQARLAYSSSGLPAGVETVVPPDASSTSGLPSGPGAPAALATRVLTDSQLATLIAEYDLYAKLRQRKSSQELVEQLRGSLSLSEPESGVLQVAFRYPDQQTTRALTNGVAVLLASYQVVTTVRAPAVPAPGKSRRRSREAGPKAVTTKTVAPAVAARPVSAAPVQTDTQDVARMSHEVDRVDNTLTDLASAKQGLEVQQREVEAKISALEKSERKAAAAEGRVGAQDGAHERTVLEQQITVEKAKLADLRDRYTEQYPDVQREESVIADLQTRLARMPDTAAVATNQAANESTSPAMQRLRQEQDRVQSDLSRNASQAALEQSRKSELLLQMEQARTALSHPGAPVTPAIAPPVVVAPAQAQKAATESGPEITVRILPFRLVETAGSAGQVGVSRLALSVWLAIGTLVLVALCFAPLVPAHYSAVVESAEDLHQNVPEHVTYLGDVGRSEP